MENNLEKFKIFPFYLLTLIKDWYNMVYIKEESFEYTWEKNQRVKIIS